MQNFVRFNSIESKIELSQEFLGKQDNNVPYCSNYIYPKLFLTHRQRDIHFPEIVKSCWGHPKTCKSIKNKKSKICTKPIFYSVYIEESKKDSLEKIIKLRGNLVNVYRKNSIIFKRQFNLFSEILFNYSVLCKRKKSIIYDTDLKFRKKN